MAMTAALKDELGRVEATKACCRKAEVSTILRFSSGLHLVAGKIVVEADVDTAPVAARVIVLPSVRTACGRHPDA